MKFADIPIHEILTPRERLVTVPEGTLIEKAKEKKVSAFGSEMITLNLLKEDKDAKAL